LHNRDLDLLKNIQLFFGVGYLKISKRDNCVSYTVGSVSDLVVIINFFNEYPLQSSKKHMFNIFVVIHSLYQSKEHLELTGFLKTVAFINHLNKPINPFTLKTITELGPLPNILLPSKFLYDDKKKSSLAVVSDNPQDAHGFKKFTPNPFWIAGFVTGEGSFTYFTRTRATVDGNTKLDYTLVFEVSQLTQDRYLLQGISDYLNCGSIYSETRGISRIRIATIPLISCNVLPFFFNFPLMGFKHQQFLIWSKAVNVMLKFPTYSLSREASLTSILSELKALTRK
jgi:hypothetical protein